VVTTDLRATQHVLVHSDTLEKSLFVRRFLGRALGWGVLVAEGALHRAQRRVLNPAFGPAQVRELSGIFLDKSNEVRMPFRHVRVWLTSQQLRDLWLSKLDPSTSAARLNAVADLSAATLDIIGLAGFDYAFNALSRLADNPDELSAAFAEVVRAESAFTLALNGSLPGAEYIPTRAQRHRLEMRRIMDRIGRELIKERKAAAA
jgi:cytochrome P450